MEWIEIKRNTKGEISDETIEGISNSFPVLILDMFDGEPSVHYKECWDGYPSASDLHSSEYTHYCHIDLPNRE
jgi:hypothetical protein